MPDRDDEVTSPYGPQRRVDALRAAHDLLVPGGRLAFDVFAPSPDDIAETHGRWIEREPGIWERATWDDAARRLTLDVRGHGVETTLRLTWLPTAQWPSLLERAGFEVDDRTPGELFDASTVERCELEVDEHLFLCRRP